MIGNFFKKKRELPKANQVTIDALVRLIYCTGQAIGELRKCEENEIEDVVDKWFGDEELEELAGRAEKYLH